MNKTDQDGNTELHLAAYNCDEKRIRELVQMGADVNVRNKNSETPLHAVAAAATNKNSIFINIIKHLIENGGDVFALEKEADGTFLHFLLLEGSLTSSQFNDMTTFLVEKNYSKLFNYPGRSTGQTSLMWAVHNIEVSDATLSLLHQSGVDFTAVDHSGSGLLVFAIEGKRSVAAISRLIEFGADWRHLDNKQRSLIHIAGISGHVDALKFFIELGLDTNQRDSCGETPLHLVMQWGKENVLEVVRVLLQNGAVTKRNYKGETALEVAIGKGHMPDKNDIIDLLINAE